VLVGFLDSYVEALFSFVCATSPRSLEVSVILVLGNVLLGIQSLDRGIRDRLGSGLNCQPLYKGIGGKCVAKSFAIVFQSP